MHIILGLIGLAIATLGTALLELDDLPTKEQREALDEIRRAFRIK
jgi:hypothetical protein